MELDIKPKFIKVIDDIQIEYRKQIKIAQNNTLANLGKPFNKFDEFDPSAN